VNGHVAPLACDFTNTNNGQRKLLEGKVFFDDGDGDDAKKRGPQPIDRFIDAEKFAVAPTPGASRPALSSPWPSAHKDITFAIDLRLDAGPKPIVRFGGRAAGADNAPVFPITFDFAPFVAPPRPKGVSAEDWAAEFRWHQGEITHIDLSPNNGGSEIGVVAQLAGAHWTETSDSKRMLVKSFAARIYNDTAMRSHESKSYAAARDLFAKATAADPDQERYAYNLACAESRLGHKEEARAALAIAIKLGGPTVKARAAKDDDFTPVRNEPWFK